MFISDKVLSASLNSVCIFRHVRMYFLREEGVFTSTWWWHDYLCGLCIFFFFRSFHYSSHLFMYLLFTWYGFLFLKFLSTLPSIKEEGIQFFSFFWNSIVVIAVFMSFRGTYVCRYGLVYSRCPTYRPSACLPACPCQVFSFFFYTFNK